MFKFDVFVAASRFLESRRRRQNPFFGDDANLEPPQDFWNRVVVALTSPSKLRTTPTASRFLESRRRRQKNPRPDRRRRQPPQDFWNRVVVATGGDLAPAETIAASRFLESRRRRLYFCSRSTLQHLPPQDFWNRVVVALVNDASHGFGQPRLKISGIASSSPGRSLCARTISSPASRFLESRRRRLDADGTVRNSTGPPQDFWNRVVVATFVEP